MTHYENSTEHTDAAQHENEAASLDLSHEQHEDALDADAAEGGFESLNLNPALLKAVEELGYTAPTPVQVETIPAALNGGDWMVSSQTGSGKTAAFLLPAIHALLAAPPMSKGEQAARGRRAAASPRVLVLAPTRELAQQVAQEAIRLVRFCKGVRVANVVGGTAFGKQLMDLRGATLVVATPGRLLDLNRNGQIDLNAVQTLVVDEADRMLDLGFSEDLEAIHVATSKRDRTMMFSATFAPRIMELASHVMRNPQRIELATAQDTHANIEQRLHWIDDIGHKNKLLEHYLSDESMEQAVVFTATQVDADELADELRDAGYSASALHGAMPQALRNRRIRSLREGTVKILVATDVAARGIDVPTITHVINYGLPLKPEDYVHRIGRTGRAGRNGFAVTFAGARDRFRIRNIEHFTQNRIEVTTVDGLEPQTNPQMGAPRGRGGRFDRNDRNDRFGSADRGPRFDRSDRGGNFDRADRFPRENRAPRREFDAPGDRQAFGDAQKPFAREERASPYAAGARFERNSHAGPREDASAPRSFDRAPRDRGFDRARDSRHGSSFDRGPRADAQPQFARDEFAQSPRAPRNDWGRNDHSPRAQAFERNAPKAGNEARGSWESRPSFAERAPRSFDRAPREENQLAHHARAERRSDKPAGPAYTAPAEGGNRAARRAHLHAQYAAKAAGGDA